MASSDGPYFLGSDIGTSGCKSILLDAQGQILGWALKSYPTMSPYPGWAEQNPLNWYEAFCETTQQAINLAGINPIAIASVCIVGVTHNAVLLDHQDRVLRSSIIYTDIRSLPQARALLSNWGDRIFDCTWNTAGPLWTWPQLLWVRENEPDIWPRVSRILFPKDFVRNCIAPSFVSDTIDPVGTLLYDPLTSKWITEFIDTLDLPEKAFPDIAPSTQIIGQVTDRAARDTGLEPGTPVISGTTDTAAEVYGVGALEQGQAVIKLATVGRIMAISTRPIPHPAFLNYPHVLPGLWYPGTTTKFAASAFSWARRAFWDEGDQIFDYKAMDQAAERVRPGSGGVLFHPYLAGEFAPSWDPFLRASFLGMGREHTRIHFTRAVMEGVSFALRHALESVLDMGLEVNEVRLIGGGSESLLWSQIMADVLNRDILVPVGSDAAFGAALLAGVAAKFIENTPESINRLIRFRTQHTPNRSNIALYDQLFGIYQEAADAIREISHKLHQFQTDQQSILSQDSHFQEDAFSSQSISLKS